MNPTPLQFPLGEQPMASSKPDPNKSPERLWALIVGINEYQSAHLPLQGAIADAKAVEAFLLSNLRVPPAQIRALHGPKATRRGILDGFRDHFIANPAIKDGDPMLFYFAGHGTRTDAPDGWKAEGKMCEAICPWDESLKKGTSMDNSTKRGLTGDVGGATDTSVYAIPDRTLWALLHDLANVKGNNITVILDSCHSGSGTRKTRSGTVERVERIRSHRSALPVPSRLDEDIWGKFFPRDFKAQIPSGFRFGNMSSHVLLAACREAEEAREDGDPVNPRGKFTSELLSLLSKHGHQTTYSDLITNLPEMTSQHPQCEGNNKDCWLFTLESDKRAAQLFEIKQNEQNGTLTVNAGAVNGVIPGTEFTIYLSKDSPLSSAGQMKAGAVEHVTSTLLPIDRQNATAMAIPKGKIAYASISSYRDPLSEVKVFLDAPSEPPLSALVSRLSTEFGTLAKGKAGFARLTYNRTEADFIISAEGKSGKTVKLERTDNFLPMPNFSSALTHSNIPSDPQTILFILQAAAHVKFHLLRQNPSRLVNMKLPIDMYKVDQALGKGGSLYTPQGGNLLGTPTVGQADATTATASDGIRPIIPDFRTDLPFEEEGAYGITIENKSHYDLFPFVFIFDLKSYQIATWYAPASRTAAAPLKKGTKLTIGHGSLETFALRFTLDDPLKSETTFIKLFVSTDNARMETVEQDDVFDRLAEKVKALPPDPNRAGKQREAPPAKVWDTQLVGVTYSRK